MIDNYNSSVSSSSTYPRFIGVATISIKSVNPDNATLRRYGWNLPEDAAEQSYSTVKEVDGKSVIAGKVRFMVEIQDIEQKPILPMDFFVRKGVRKSKNDTYQIIDSFGRTAWGTGEEVKAHKIPKYKNGPADIASDYKACHPGQGELVAFLMKYLNVTPLQVFKKSLNAYVDSKAPGHLTIDKWDVLVEGDASEINEYVALRPENQIKVIFGIKRTPDNKTYQVFLPQRGIKDTTAYLSVNSRIDESTGEYASARKAIDKFMENGNNSDTYIFSASPVRLWEETASVVEDNSSSEFDNAADDEEDDLPF